MFLWRLNSKNMPFQLHIFEIAYDKEITQEKFLENSF